MAIDKGAAQEATLYRSEIGSAKGPHFDNFMWGIGWFEFWMIFEMNDCHC